ncbi:terminase small subunit [Pectobacterium phage Arno160]|uniref:DNA packaging protein A n=1 Tax=Pectobacterium phage Arno160 TaxID=2488835 RepID=A0A3G8F229_9CAUD|nr:terminase small subunit [Pectobacterium phage Arno160]AZF88106.1 DNA packaging protein A [Pectobacterium phage Arno160]
MDREEFEDELDAQLEREDKLVAFKALLASMDNEDLAKLLLNKSLIKLAVLLEEDMATAADFNVIRAILKDNKIGIVPTRTNAMGALKAQLDKRSKENQSSKGVIPVDELDKVDLDDFVQRH